jgi:hypothetical protein
MRLVEIAVMTKTAHKITRKHKFTFPRTATAESAKQQVAATQHTT